MICVGGIDSVPAATGSSPHRPDHRAEVFGGSDSVPRGSTATGRSPHRPELVVARGTAARWSSSMGSVPDRSSDVQVAAPPEQRAVRRWARLGPGSTLAGRPQRPNHSWLYESAARWSSSMARLGPGSTLRRAAAPPQSLVVVRERRAVVFADASDSVRSKVRWAAHHSWSQGTPRGGRSHRLRPGSKVRRAARRTARITAQWERLGPTREHCDGQVAAPELVVARGTAAQWSSSVGSTRSQIAAATCRSPHRPSNARYVDGSDAVPDRSCDGPPGGSSSTRLGPAR